MSMSRPSLSVALALLTDVARATNSQQDRETNDIIAMIFCGLTWMIMLGMIGHLVNRFLNHNPSDRFFKPQAQPTPATQSALAANKF